MRSHAKASSAGSTSGRSTTALLACLCALVLSSALTAGSAVAKTYVPGTPASFCTGTGSAAGQCEELSGVAVDTSTGSPTSGHVYVVDRGNNRIDQFNAAGTFVRAFGPGVGGAGVNVCTSTCGKGATSGALAIEANARGIAVDPATHVVYVVASAGRLIYFDGTTGISLGETTQNGAPEPFNSLSGLAVDSSAAQRYLYVAMRGVNVGPSRIEKFQIPSSPGSLGPYVCQITGTAVDVSVNHTECGGNAVPAHKNGVFEGIDTGQLGNAQPGGGLAVDANGNVFIAESLNTTTGRQSISKFDKNGNFVSQFKPPLGTDPRPVALAALPNGNILVADGGATAAAGGTRVQEYDPASPAAPVTEFGLLTIGGSIGIATLGEEVFVADKTNKKIFKYIVQPEAPSVVTGAATSVSKFKATLNGSVNPNRANVTDCHFEYLTDAAYDANVTASDPVFTGAATAPCLPASPGSGKDPVAVNANLSALQFGTEYHVRLLATNSIATAPGSAATFTTKIVNKPEALTTPGATTITQSAANLAGKVNPNEVQITNCHFKYLTDAAYQANSPADRFQGSAEAPCVPDAATIGSGGSLVNVSASLSSLAPDTTYLFLLKATNSDGTSENTDEQSFKTLPIAPLVSEASSEPGQIAAVVKAKVNPNASLSDLTACRIDYGTSTSYGQTKPCAPSPGHGTVPVEVSFSLTGLNPATPYFYRVFAANAGGSSEEAKSFITLPPNSPTAFNDGSTEGPSDTFTLEGRVDPEGIAVADCHFAYGTTAEYEKTVPCTPSAANLGSGNSPVAVTAATAPLEPNTTYHFRLFAANVRGSTQGKDRIFTTGSAPADSCANAAIRAEQGIEVVRLPDCLALEQASPSKKGNQSARLGVGANALSPDGSRVLFNSAATLGSCPNINGIGGDGFIAIRDPESGWKSECVTPPVDPEFGNSFGGLSFDPGLTSWVQMILTSSGERKFFTSGLGISRTALSPDLVNLTTSGGPEFNGASTDHSHVYLRPQGTRNGTFLPGDPQPTGQGADS
ncbi:MAG TPA: hypothetical protein VGO66_11530, partial [Solirubrobacterales bacterium]|nr:hypothetical protein [Solirubrobacterales bacterium]